MSQSRRGEQTWIDAAADRFERQWFDGPDRPHIEDCLAGADETARAKLVEELVRVECELRRDAGEQPTPAEYLVRFPDDWQAVNAAFLDEDSPSPTKRPVSAAESLLLGLLALQNNFIDRNGLLAAFNDWVTDKTRPLGQILLDRGTLTPARYALLEELVGEHIAQHGCDPERSLAELRIVPEMLDRLEQIADLDLQCSLMSVSPDAAADTEPDGSKTFDWLGETPGEDSEGRFQIVRFHDRGNLGEVYLARDSQLHRIVALKRIKHTKAADKDKRDRFVVEAEITGRLEHPCIVPVYSLGTFDDGRPFYAMRFIKGDNLETAIDRFHQDEQAGRDAGERTLALQKLLRRFLDVCNAIAYAHSRGVVHRDLKPGNIMLGQYGETLVVDWGLAKSVGRPEPVPASATLDAGTLVPESGSDRRRTVQGDLMGTPAYMSPEQASGRIDQLGPASDVYSLGATLYCLLTGSPPFEKQPHAELLPKVQQGAFAPPRQVQGWIDPALEAICLKAMKTDPAQRYANPRALADDVEHWLADEPVGAYTEPVTARAKRWMRQHPSRVTAAVVLLLATVVGLTAGAVLLTQMNRRVEAEKAVSDANFQMARDAVDEFFTRVSNEKLLDEGRLKPLRKSLLEQALKFYRNFIKRQENNSSVRRDLARACFRAGVINELVGMDAEGQAEAKRGEEIFAGLMTKSPKDSGLRVELADGLSAMASVQRDAGFSKPALANWSRAIEIWEQLWAENPSDVPLAPDLVVAHSFRVLVKNQTGDEEGAAADTRRAETIFEQVKEVCSPDQKDAMLDALAGVYYRCPDMGKCLQAISIYRGLSSRTERERVDVAFRIVSKYGLHPTFSKWSLRGALQNGGNFLNFSGHPLKAEPLLRESVDIVRALMRSDPEADYPILYLEVPLGNVGESLFLQGQIRLAKKALEEVMALREQVERRGIPFGGPNLMYYAEYAYFLACAEGESGDFPGAIRHCDLALQVTQEVRKDDRSMSQDNPVILHLEAWLREARSRFEFGAGKIGREELITRQRQIVAERKSLHDRGIKAYSFPGSQVNEWSAAAAVLAGGLLDAGRAEEALAAIGKVLPEQQKLVDNDNPDNREVPEYDLRAYLFRQVLAELLSRQAEALAKLGKPADAAKSIRRAIEVIEPFTKPEPCYLYDLAHHLTLASTLPASAGVDHAAERAIKALRDSIASGFDNPYKLRHDPRLEPLRTRDDFQKLIKDLETRLSTKP